CRQCLSDQIAARRLLLDQVIDERLVQEAPTRVQLDAALATCVERMRGEDAERQVEILCQFQSAALCRVAVAALTGTLPLMKVSDRLTDIAEVIVQQSLAMVWEQLTARYGEPRRVTE